jgi:hypothetical protein
MDKHMNPPESREIQEQQKEDSFRQNASFAEKNLQNGRIFSPLNDEHDIKSMNREKVENMIIKVDIHSKEAPLDPKTLGRKGIIEWIWKHKVMADVPSTFLKSYLQKKKKVDAMYFYQHYKLVCELVQQVALFRRIPMEQVSDLDLCQDSRHKFYCFTVLT